MLSHLSVSGSVAGLPTTPLHWLISDGREAMAVEPLSGGLSLTDDPVGVLTNSPPLSYHMTRLDDFRALSPKNPPAADGVVLYSRGMGAIGLPGGFSSSARFVRAAFLRENCTAAVDGTEEVVGRALDVLSSVSLPRGAVLSDEGEPVYTRYSAVMDMESPSYYLTTATCRTVHRLTLSDALRDECRLHTFPLYREENIAQIG
jgi:choloylglycine hydrolase